MVRENNGAGWESELKWYDYILFSLVTITCFFVFFFRHDIWFTAQSSMAILNGHFSDFYEYNLHVMGGNDYYILIYLLFALWNVPLKLLGISVLINDSSIASLLMLLYQKLLPMLFWAAAVPFVFRISIACGSKVKMALYQTLLFLASPLAMITVTAWGCYDALGVFFLVVGLSFYMNESRRTNLYLAALLFGMAASIKSYFLFLLIPLFLYREKNLVKLGSLLLSLIAPIILQIIAFNASSAFMGNAAGSSDFTERLFSLQLSNLFLPVAIFPLVWVLVCLIAYYVPRDADNPRKALYIGIVAASSFIGLVPWHPQWLVMLSPFLAVLIGAHKRRNQLMLVEFVFMAAFTAIVFGVWQGQFSDNLVLSSVFGNYISNHQKASSSIVYKIFQPKYLMAYTAILDACLLCFIATLNPWFSRAANEPIENILRKDYLLLHARLLAGIGICLGPVLLWVFRVLA